MNSQTPDEHRARAEQYTKTAELHLTEDPRDMEIAKVAAGIAQAHALAAIAGYLAGDTEPVLRAVEDVPTGGVL